MYVLVQPGGGGEEEQWWWDYLDTKARRALELLLDNGVTLVMGLSGREAVLALFSEEILRALSLSSSQLFELILLSMKSLVGNETGFRLALSGERASFEGGDQLGEERVVRGTTLNEGVTVKVYVGWGVGKL